MAAMRSFTTAVRSVAVGPLEGAMRRVDSEDAERTTVRPFLNLEAVLLERLTPLLQQALVAGGMAGSRALASGNFRAAATGFGTILFNRRDPEAERWARAHAAELVTGLTEESRAAVRSTITRMFTDEVPAREAAKLVRLSVGLTEAQAAAVANLRKTLLESPGKRVYAGRLPIRVPVAGIPAGRLDRELTRYADKLTRQRALTIAVHEPMVAANEGQRLLWRQGVQRGQLTGREQREWIVADDERLCPICRPLDATLAPLTGAYEGGRIGPPAHVRCRCTEGLRP